MDFKEYVENKITIFETLQRNASAILTPKGEIIAKKDSWEENDYLDWYYECQICGEDIKQDNWDLDNKSLEDRLKDHFKENHKGD